MSAKTTSEVTIVDLTDERDGRIQQLEALLKQRNEQLRLAFNDLQAYGAALANANVRLTGMDLLHQDMRREIEALGRRLAESEAKK